MKQLKFNPDKDMKELEKYGFEKLEDDYRGHKYSWKRYLDNYTYYELYINKDNRMSFYFENPTGASYLRIVSKMFVILYDLIKANLLIVEDKDE